MLADMLNARRTQPFFFYPPYAPRAADFAAARSF